MSCKKLIVAYFGPVFPIADVIQIPAGGQDDIQSHLSYVKHRILPVSFPHIRHRVWQDLRKLPHSQILLFILQEILLDIAAHYRIGFNSCHVIYNVHLHYYMVQGKGLQRLRKSWLFLESPIYITILYTCTKHLM